MAKGFEGFAAYSAGRVQDECISQIVHFTKQAEAITAELDSAQEIAIKRLMTKRWFPCKTREAAIARLDMEWPSWHLDPRHIRLDRLRDELLRIKACPGATDEIIGICERGLK